MNIAIGDVKKVFYVFLLPHLVVYHTLNPSVKQLVKEDIDEMNRRLKINKGLLFYLTFYKSYRNLFYHRIGFSAKIFKLYVREYKSFIIGESVQMDGGACVINHPYGTIINCKTIGKNFSVCQLTTIGNAIHGRNDLIPVIGDNVTLGANVTIIGDIKIGNNVIVGAGSVVVKDVPDDCVVAGNPARIIRVINN